MRTQAFLQFDVEFDDGSSAEVTAVLNGTFSPGNYSGPPESCFPDETEVDDPEEIELSTFAPGVLCLSTQAMEWEALPEWARTGLLSQMRDPRWRPLGRDF